VAIRLQAGLTPAAAISAVRQLAPSLIGHRRMAACGLQYGRGDAFVEFVGPELDATPV